MTDGRGGRRKNSEWNIERFVAVAKTRLSEKSLREIHFVIRVSHFQVPSLFRGFRILILFLSCCCATLIAFSQLRLLTLICIQLDEIRITWPGLHFKISSSCIFTIKLLETSEKEKRCLLVPASFFRYFTVLLTKNLYFFLPGEQEPWSQQETPKDIFAHAKFAIPAPLFVHLPPLSPHSTGVDVRAALEGVK